MGRMGWRMEEAGQSGEVVVAPMVYEWGNGGGGGISNFGTRLSEMWGKLRKYPHRFELGGSFGSGVSRAFHVSGFHRRWEFSRAL